MYNLLNLVDMLDMVCMFMYLTGLLVFCSVRKHLLLSLLSLEYLVLVLFMVLFYYFMKCGCGGYFILLYLTYAVSEGVLGLSILVSLIRCHGNDNMSCKMVLW